MPRTKQFKKLGLSNFWTHSGIKLPEQAPLNFHTLDAMTERKELMDIARFSESDFHQTSALFINLHHKPISKVLPEFPKK